MHFSDDDPHLRRLVRASFCLLPDGGHSRQCSPSLRFSNNHEQLRVAIPVLLSTHTLLTFLPRTRNEKNTMAPVRGRKRKSDQSVASNEEHEQTMLASQKIPTKIGDAPSGESPLKRRRRDITLAQKQALIENLQLESRNPYPQHSSPLETRS